MTVDQLLPFCASAPADTVCDIDPGVIPEGDYLMDITFTSDGSKVLVCNYMSENITVMDWSPMTVDTTFAVDGYPGEIAIATSPGPDYAMYVKYTLAGVEEGSIGIAGMPGLDAGGKTVSRLMIVCE